MSVDDDIPGNARPACYQDESVYLREDHSETDFYGHMIADCVFGDNAIMPDITYDEAKDHIIVEDVGRRYWKAMGDKRVRDRLDVDSGIDSLGIKYILGDRDLSANLVIDDSGTVHPIDFQHTGMHTFDSVDDLVDGIERDARFYNMTRNTSPSFDLQERIEERLHTLADDMEVGEILGQFYTEILPQIEEKHRRLIADVLLTNLSHIGAYHADTRATVGDTYRAPDSLSIVHRLELSWYIPDSRIDQVECVAVEYNVFRFLHLTGIVFIHSYVRRSPTGGCLFLAVTISNALTTGVGRISGLPAVETAMPSLVGGA